MMRCNTNGVADRGKTRIYRSNQATTSDGNRNSGGPAMNTQNAETKVWIRPQLVRLGKIADVANIAPGSLQTSGGPACTPGSPSCALS
jgi:hypothetical protein